VFASEFLQDDVDVIIGECKSLSEMEQKQKDAIMRLGERTGAYLAFCTLADDFAADDKAFFERLVIAGQRLILLTRKHLEMPYLEIRAYRHHQNWLGRDAELLSRVTITEIFGNAFAELHRRRV
jgi:hypothetical protein